MGVLRDALRRKLRADPGVQVVRRQRRAVGHRAPDQAGGRHGARRRGAIRQGREAGLVRVVDAPEGPHPGGIVRGDVAVVEELSRALLHAARAALDLEVVGLTGARGLGVEARRRRQLRLRRLVEAGLLVVERLVGRRVEAPADAAAVHVEDVEHLRARVQDAELRRVAEVGARGRRRRIPERVAAVRLRIVGVLVEPVHERLGAVVDRTRAGAVGAGVLVDRRQRHAVLVIGSGVRLLVADLVPQQRVLAERLGRAGRADHGLPAGGVSGWPSAPSQVEPLGSTTSEPKRPCATARRLPGPGRSRCAPSSVGSSGT